MVIMGETRNASGFGLETLLEYSKEMRGKD
jgi:hypothetical protein